MTPQKSGLVTRICLIGSALLHVTPAIILLGGFSWLPNGLALLALPFLVLGAACLWASPPVLAALGALNALAFLVLGGIGANAIGDHHGVDVLFFGSALLPLANALMLGYAYGRIRKLTVPPPKSGRSVSYVRIWVAGALLLAAAGWFIKTRHSPADQVPTPPDIETRVKDHPDEGIDTANPVLSGYQRAFLEAVLRRSRLIEPPVSDPRDTSGGKMYLSTARYGDEGNIQDDTLRPSSLSCRSTILRSLLPKVISGWPKKTRFHFSGSIQGDSLFRTLGCMEFPQDRRYYELAESYPSDSAFWRPMIPDYQVDIEVRSFWKDSARWADGSIETDSLLEDATVAFEVRPKDPWSYASWAGLILQSTSELDTLPFAYAWHALKAGVKPDWDSAHRMLTFRSETGEMGATAFKTLIWTQRFEIPAMSGPDSGGSTFHGVELNAMTSDGKSVILAEGNTIICGNDLKFRKTGKGFPVLESGVEEASPLVLSDIDGDGASDVLIESRVLGKRWIFIRQNGIRFEVVIRPPHERPPCC
jgi:hypothetical protein